MTRTLRRRGGRVGAGAPAKKAWARKDKAPRPVPIPVVKKVKEYVPYVLVRSGEEPRNMGLQICGETTWAEFVPIACTKLGRQPDYPINLTVTVGLNRVVPAAGMTMSMVYQLHMCNGDALLYLTHDG